MTASPRGCQPDPTPSRYGSSNWDPGSPQKVHQWLAPLPGCGAIGDWGLLPGGVASLNHRLQAYKPPACPHAPAPQQNNRGGEQMLTPVKWIPPNGSEMVRSPEGETRFSETITGDGPGSRSVASGRPFRGLSGLGSLPRPLAWAGMSRPFRPQAWQPRRDERCKPAVKLMRRLRVHLYEKTCLATALAALRRAYASL